MVPDRPRLTDGSERVRRELAAIVDQLSCLRTESSKLTVTRDAPEILCHKLRLVSEHAESSTNLKCSFLKPFLQLLTVDAPSSVKQGIWVSLQTFPLEDVSATIFYHCLSFHYSWNCTKPKYRNKKLVFHTPYLKQERS